MSPRQRTFLVSAALVLSTSTALVVLDACVGDDPSTVPAEAGDTTDAGTDSVAAQDVVQPEDCSILYVVSGASPQNDGCTTKAPLPTIAAAIAAVKARTLPTKEIHVCQGTYRETTLVLDIPVSLRGGYSCQTWQRQPGIAYPTLTDPFETQIINGGFDRAPDTLRISGAAVNKDVLIDRFTIVAGPGDVAPGSSFGVQVDMGAMPKLVENVILGGKTTGMTAQFATGSCAIRFLSSGGELFHNVIRGGASSTTGHDADGSTGLQITSQTAAQLAPWVHENTIEGGSGISTGVTFGRGSVAVHTVGGVMTQKAGTPFERNVVRAGNGNVVSTNPTTLTMGSVGMWVGGATEIDILDNYVEGGTGTVSIDGDIGARTIYLLSRAMPARVIGNAVLGPTTTAGTSVGIEGTGSAPIEVTNNWIVGGSAKKDARSLVLGGSSNFVVRHNTIVAPTTTQAGAFNNAIVVIGGREAIIENNIIAGRGADTGLGLWECPTSERVTSFQNNAFVGTTTLYRTYAAGNPDAGCVDSRSLMVELEDVLKDAGADLIQQNVRLASSCAGEDGGCLAFTECNTADNCQKSVFLGWDKARPDLLLDGGMRLTNAATLPCAIATGGLSLVTDGGAFVKPDAASLAPVAKDLYGTTRTPGVSRGAHELDNATCR